MYRVELYAQVRRSVIVEGLSEREAVKRFGLARETVRKMLRYRIPPGYRRNKPVRRPKLEAFTGIINQILNDDRERPRKQRHTAQRIFDRLRDEYEFTGGYTIVKDYVREKKLGGQEMFVPLRHPPGDAQADFGEAVVVINGVQRKAHFLVVDLPHSDDAFVKAFPAETTEAFCTTREAVQLVLQASTMGNGSDIFVLDMGEPVRIVDLARNMIRLSGLEPDEDIEIRYTGLRPGEKLFEELTLEGENILPTYHEKIRIFQAPPLDSTRLEVWLLELEALLEARGAGAVVDHLKELVPEYQPEGIRVELETTARASTPMRAE